MAAVLTTTSLTILNHSTLKHPPSVVNSTSPLASPPSSLSWSAETGTVFLASENGALSQYEVVTGTLQDFSIAARTSTEPVVSLLYKDRGSTIIYGQGQQVVVLSTSTGKPANTFDTHKSTITSLSLSNDCSLLASTSAHAIHVHNLTLASHTVLRGIPSSGSKITTCAFHPHSRTRLLVGIGSQLLVYDTTRPSGPAKAIEVDKEKKGLGQITAISCSPFSKTLVAVACSGGTVALIDLEKEKGLFRMVTMPAPITCLSFSAEGAAVFAGTENGKFLVLDLRALDKPPKSITISESGDRIVALCVQRKLKPGEAQTKPAAAASKPLVQRDVNKATTTIRPSASNEPTKKPLEKETGKAPLKPARPRAASGTTATTGTTTTPRRPIARTASASNQANAPAGRVASGSRPSLCGAAQKSPVSRPSTSEVPQRAFSPPKSPIALVDKNNEGADDGDLSVRIENLLALPKGKGPALSTAPEEAAQPPVSSRAPSVLSRASSRSQLSEGGRARTHARTESASHGPAAESISTAAPRARSGSSASAAGRTSKASVRSALGKSSISPVRVQSRRTSGSTISRSQTPSPELPDVNDVGPVTPIPAYKMKGKERGRVLGTPEIDKWVEAGEAKDGPREGRHVGFAADSDYDDDEENPMAGEARRSRSPASDSEEDEDRDAGRQGGYDRRPPRAQPELAMQISPRRSFPGGPSTNPSTRWAPVPSPLRNPASTSANGHGHGPVPPSPQARAAQDMLQALLRDALHDFRAETKQEIVGLHLDLIRMGTSWRREMQDALGGIGEELRALREENARLREENERLRRGY
ncbi:WD40-repeat-containing domain protein [Cubamyces lactineus]|nr:WD40-repeat-containing domain protein [Cubamyces lactineus]